MGQHPGHRGQGDDVVDHGGPSEEALEGGDGRLGPHLAALALEALEHRRLLAADVGAGADAHLHVEGEIGPEDVLTQPAPGPGGLDRGLHGHDGVGVLGAEVDEALGGAGGVGGDGHALEEGEGVALHQHAVGEGAGVTLVGVAADELHVGLCPGDRPPLDAGGEAGTAPAAEARVDDCFDHGLGAHGQRGAQSGDAAVALVVVRRAGVDDPDPGEGEALLATQPVEVLDGPEAGCGALQHPLADEAVDLLGLDRAVAHPTPIGLHLHERLEPEHAP